MIVKDELEKSERRGVRWLKATFVSFIAIAVCDGIIYVWDDTISELLSRIVLAAPCLIGLILLFGTIIECEHYDQLKMEVDNDDMKKA